MAKGIKTGGRRPGSPNKFTSSVKDAFAEAFNKLGGAEALFLWGKENQTDFYKLASKLIPADVNMAVEQFPQANVYPMEPNERSELPVASEAVDSVH